MSETEKIKLENASSFDITTDNMKYKLIISWYELNVYIDIIKKFVYNLRRGGLSS